MDASIANANQQFDKVLRPLFENRTFLACLGLFFALYAGFLAPALPNRVIMFFDTIPGKLLFIFLIAFVASRNVDNSLQVALIVSVIFLISLVVLNNLKMKEAFRTLGAEHFEMMDQVSKVLNKQNSANEEGCKKALNWCAVKGEPTLRGQLWNEGVVGNLPTEGAELPKDDKFYSKNCPGYFKTCMANNDKFKFSPSIEEHAEKDCKAVFTKDKCEKEYDIKPANEESCGSIFDKQKCMSQYQLIEEQKH